jgi:uncharacterized protein
MDYEPYLKVAMERAQDDPAHDKLHVQRVFANAKRILQNESADDEIVLTAVLLHELFNYPKNHPLRHESGNVCADHAAVILQEYDFPAHKADAVLHCIRNHSFSSGRKPETLEQAIVQDADRLDAIGAIGVARCFSTCATMQRPFYHEQEPVPIQSEADDQEYGLDHFYKKLFLLAERMHTRTARHLAEERTRFMQLYVNQLVSEIQA